MWALVCRMPVGSTDGNSFEEYIVEYILFRYVFSALRALDTFSVRDFECAFLAYLVCAAGHAKEVDFNEALLKQGYNADIAGVIFFHGPEYLTGRNLVLKLKLKVIAPKLVYGGCF